MSGRSIPILKYNTHRTDRYSLDTEAVSEIFENFPNIPVMIFSIVGLARKGKSFFLNFVISYLEHLERGKTVYNVDKVYFFLGIDEEWNHLTTRPNCFNWNFGRNRVTVGIHMWNRPFIIKLSDGSEVAILVMDTQGTFDGNTNETECASTFALSTLISSLQVYNIMREVNESDLQHLARFTAFANFAGNQSGTKSSQHLVFLLRDWSYPDQDPYGRQGGEQYVDDILKNATNRCQQNIELRKDILSAFKKISGFNLPKPGKEVEINGGEGSDLSRLKPNFVTYMKQFLEETFSMKNIVLKTVNGTIIKPSHLRQRIEMWANCFKGDQMPRMEDVYTQTLRIDDDAAIKVAVKQLRKDFEDYIQVTPNWDTNTDDLREFFLDTKETYFKAPGLGNTDERRLNAIDTLNLQLTEECESLLLIALQRRNEARPAQEQESNSSILMKASMLAGVVLVGAIAVAAR